MFKEKHTSWNIAASPPPICNYLCESYVKCGSNQKRCSDILPKHYVSMRKPPHNPSSLKELSEILVY